MITKKKLKKMSSSFKDHFYSLVDDIKNIYSTAITSKQEAAEKLNENPSIETLFEIEDFINSSPTNNFAVDSKNYYLCDLSAMDDNVSYKKRQTILNNIFKKLKLKDFTTNIYRITENWNDKYVNRYYFLLHLGKNGSGDFVDDDMKEITEIIHVMRENGATDASPFDVFIDLADDVSTWAICFGLEGNV